MLVGTLGALVHGCSLPVFLRFFADLVDSFGSHADDPDTMVRLVVKYAFYFLVVGAAIWASSWAGNAIPPPPAAPRVSNRLSIWIG